MPSKKSPLVYKSLEQAMYAFKGKLPPPAPKNSVKSHVTITIDDLILRSVDLTSRFDKAEFFREYRTRNGEYKHRKVKMNYLQLQDVDYSMYDTCAMSSLPPVAASILLGVYGDA